MTTLPELEPHRWTLPRALDARVVETPDRPCVTTEGEGTETFAECRSAALAMTGTLRAAGVGAGDLVAVMSPNCRTAIHAWMGANLLGAADVMVNTGYRGNPLEHALNLVQAKVLIAEVRFLGVLREAEPRLEHLKRIVWFRLPDGEGAGREPAGFSRIELVPLDSLSSAPAEPRAEPDVSSLASVIYTSGTSGPAKGVMIPHAQAYALALQTVQGLRLASRDTLYCFHPMFHTAGKFISLYAGLLSGAQVVLDRQFRAERWLSRIRESGATATLAHGAMLEMVHAMPSAADDAENPLERLMASPFPRRIAADFERRFGVRGVEVWGMTEVNNPLWCPLDEPLHTGTCGKLNSDWADVRVVDPETDFEVPAGQVGELVVRPKRPWTMMQGYIGLPEKTVRAWRNLWFHTGDAAYVDADGWYHFVDRLGDRIRRRAENISSYEIESAAALHPAVRECAAIGVPSGYESDDDIKLFVALQPGHAWAPEDLLEHLVRLLPHYMVPRYLQAITALPRTPTNKVMKAELRDAQGESWDRKAAGVALRDLARRVGSASGASPASEEST
ncbi:MAG: AMP-binding protein [Ideonella sp.]|nr:AMP-binding protein [Ideonella sp.]